SDRVPVLTIPLAGVLGFGTANQSGDRDENGSQRDRLTSPIDQPRDTRKTQDALLSSCPCCRESSQFAMVGSFCNKTGNLATTAKVLASTVLVANEELLKEMIGFFNATPKKSSLASDRVSTGPRQGPIISARMARERQVRGS